MLSKTFVHIGSTMLLTLLFSCQKDDSFLPVPNSEDLPASQAISSNEQGDVVGIPEPPTLGFDVLLVPEYCTTQGTTLWALNPGRPGNPPFNQPEFTVKWFVNGQLIGTGPHLTDCICGQKVTAKVEKVSNGQKGTAAFTTKPCGQTTSEAQ